MSNHRNNYIKYKRAELEEYIRYPETCVKKIRAVESLRFAPNIIGTFKDSIMRILSKKIGKFDTKLDGVVLDFRKTKILNTSSLARTDSTSMLINIETDFYVFSPRKDVIVNGIVKHINRQSMETIISVVIYRVFNVKVMFKGNVKQQDLKIDQDIKICIKDFHFDNVIPYIEGDLVALLSRKINFDDVADSGISESSITSPSKSTKITIKKEPVDIEYEEPINDFASNSRKRKRKVSIDLDVSTIQPSKKIKQERTDVDDEEVNVKQERISDDELFDDSLVSKTNERVINTSTSEEGSHKKKKKKSKKDKKNKYVDDFESSLLMLFDTPKVKQEKVTE